MLQSEFDETIQILNDYANKIVEKKRPDYTQEHIDVLHNFKQAALAAGITPMQAWLVHFHKQYSAVAKWVKSPKKDVSEPMVDRFADLRNYIYLGFALMQETTLNEQDS